MIVHSLRSTNELTLAVAMVGATIMPHALYLHSSLTQTRIMPRNKAERRRLIDWSRHEILFPLSIPGLVNLAMVVMAAAAFHGRAGCYNIDIQSARTVR